MTNRMPEVPLEMCVGDHGVEVSHQFAKATRIEAQPLTGYSGWCTFAYVGVNPHVVRACKIDEANGVAIYEFQGDELPAAGDIEYYFTICPADFYIGSAPGSFSHEYSSKVLRIIVRELPT